MGSIYKMSKFIKLHLREPKYEIKYLGSRIGYTRHQIGWHDVKGDEVYFSVDKIETFTDYKVNDIDVCETADEILKELEQ